VDILNQILYDKIEDVGKTSLVSLASKNNRVNLVSNKHNTLPGLYSFFDIFHLKELLLKNKCPTKMI